MPGSLPAHRLLPTLPATQPHSALTWFWVLGFSSLFLLSLGCHNPREKHCRVVSRRGDTAPFPGTPGSQKALALKSAMVANPLTHA